MKKETKTWGLDHLLIGAMILSFILLIILAYGCVEIRTREINRTINNTIYVQNVTFINKECPKTTIIYVQNKTGQTDKDCKNKLTFCNIRADELNRQLFDCLTSNTSREYENVSETIKDCEEDKKILKDKLHNISRFI